MKLFVCKGMSYTNRVTEVGVGGHASALKIQMLCWTWTCHVVCECDGDIKVKCLALPSTVNMSLLYSIISFNINSSYIFSSQKIHHVKVKGPLILVLDLLIIRRGWYICGNCENGFTVYMYKPFNLYDFRNLSHV